MERQTEHCESQITDDGYVYIWKTEPVKLPHCGITEDLIYATGPLFPERPFPKDESEITADSHNLEGKRGSDSTSQAKSAARKSQEAAVSALIHTLKNAPPLRQDSSCYSSLSSMKPDAVGGGGANSSFCTTRKISDAMEELKSYRQMKEMLLSKSGSKIFKKEEN